MSENSRKIINTWYGINEFEAKLVLITPVSGIFNVIEKKGKIILSTKGWHKRSLIEYKGNRFELLHFSKGQQIKDILEILKNENLIRLFFVGYCGYLGSDDRIGWVISPSKVYYDQEKPIIINDLNQGSIKAVPTMLMEEKYYQNLKEKNINYIDMESYFIARWSRENTKAVSMFFVVSDQPLNLPFYAISKGQSLLILKGVQKAMDQVAETLLYFKHALR